MVSKNTEEAIRAFRFVLQKERELNNANKDLSSAVLLIPEIEKVYYVKRTEEIRKLYEGQECVD